MPDYDVDVLVALGVDEKQAKKLRTELDNVESNIAAVGETIRASFEGESAKAVESAMARFEKAADNTRKLADAQNYAQQQIMALQATESSASGEIAKNQEEQAQAVYRANVAYAQQQRALVDAANAQAQYTRVFESGPFVSGLGDVRRFENQLESVESQWDAIAQAAKEAAEIQKEATGGGGTQGGGTQGSGPDVLTVAQKAGAGIRVVGDALDQLTGISPVAAQAIRGIGVSVANLSVTGVATSVGVLALNAAIQELNASVERNQTIVKSNNDAYREVNRRIREGITSDELRNERQKRVRELEDERENLARLNAERAAIEADLAKNPVLSIATQLRGDLNVFNELTLESRTNIDRLSKSIELVDESFGSVELAANDAAAAMERAANQIDNKLLNELNVLTYASGQTAEQIQEQIDSIIERKALVAQLLNSQQLSADATKRLNDEMILLNGEMILLTDSILPVALATARLNAANEDAQRQQDETIAATRKFNSEMAKLAQDTNNARLKTENDYADKILDLTRKFNQDLEDANIELGRDLSDLVKEAGRDTGDATRQARQDRLQEEIQFNNETKKQARDLQRDLLKIREDSADQEEELIRNRDFAGLRNLRRERNRALDDAVDSFNAEQREREIAFREQQQLTNQQLKFEAETRRIRFEQQVVDARQAYDRENEDLNRNLQRQRQVLSEARNKELALIANTQNSKLGLLSQGFQTELRMAAQTAQQRIAIQRQVDQALLAQANAFRAGFGLTGGSSNTANVSNAFNFSGGGSVQQNAALAGVIAAEVGRQIKNLLG